MSRKRWIVIALLAVVSQMAFMSSAWTGESDTILQASDLDVTSPGHVPILVATHKTPPGEVKKEPDSTESVPTKKPAPETMVEEEPLEDPYAMSEGLDGTLTLGGAGIVTDDESFKLGEYNGVTGNEGYLVGHTDLAYNRDEYYMDLIARDLGLESRQAYFEVGRYGRYEFFADINQSPHLINGVNQSIFANPGSNALTLNPGFGTGANNSTMTIVNRGTGLGIQTDSATLGIHSEFGKYQFGLTFQRNETDGLKSMGAAFGFLTTVLPDPIDQTTNEISGFVERSGDRGQMRMYFDLSYYDNKNETVTWQSPYTGVSAFGRISRAPDNQHYRLGMSGGYNLSDRSRVSGTLEYGLMRQNQTLVPFEISGTIGTLPRSTADAKIHTLHAMLNFSHRPISKLALDLRFRHYQTFNDTPKTSWNYVTTDGGAQAGVDALANLPYDYGQQTIDADASYYLFKGTTIKAGYQWQQTDRSFRSVDGSQENTLKAGFKSNYFESISTGYSFSYAMRDVDSPYDQAVVFGARHGPGATDPFIQHPLMRQFDIANRDRTKHSANVNWFPTRKVQLSYNFNFMRDQFDAAFFGMEFFKQQAHTFDWTYFHSEHTRYNAYYTLEKIDITHNNRAYSNLAQSIDPTRDWRASTDNVVHTFGAGVDYETLRNKLLLSLNYWYSNSEEDIRFVAGPNAGFVGNLPALVTRSQNVDVKGQYKIRTDMEVGLRYLFQAFETDDFATDGFQPSSASVASLLSLSGTVQDYEAHTAMLYFTYHLGN